MGLLCALRAFHTNQWLLYNKKLQSFLKSDNNCVCVFKHLFGEGDGMCYIQHTDGGMAIRWQLLEAWLVPSFYHVSLRIRVLRVGSKHLYLITHLINHSFTFKTSLAMWSWPASNSQSFHLCMPLGACHIIGRKKKLYVFFLIFFCVCMHMHAHAIWCHTYVEVGSFLLPCE